ncbi:probable G-protein coupled receptor 146 isoform X8 [Phalacrocorax carbo]|uniref:probable G-protein coupled receptor 146 isoform X8 n=1 Tax=Phalacrocorax carbo TaxID=9209 RepID=UPI00311A333F
MKSLLKISNKESLEFSSHRTLCFQKFCRKEKVAQSQTDILLGCTSRTSATEGYSWLLNVTSFLSGDSVRDLPYPGREKLLKSGLMLVTV